MINSIYKLFNTEEDASTICEPIFILTSRNKFLALTLRNKGIFYTRRKFTFDDNDLSDENPKSEIGEEQRLEALSKELAKVTRRQMSIIGTIHDQRNILLALATKAGVDAHEEDSENVIWAEMSRSVVNIC